MNQTATFSTLLTTFVTHVLFLTVSLAIIFMTVRSVTKQPNISLIKLIANAIPVKSRDVLIVHQSFLATSVTKHPSISLIKLITNVTAAKLKGA